MIAVAYKDKKNPLLLVVPLRCWGTRSSWQSIRGKSSPARLVQPPTCRARRRPATVGPSPLPPVFQSDEFVFFLFFFFFIFLIFTYFVDPLYFVSSSLFFIMFYVTARGKSIKRYVSHGIEVPVPRPTSIPLMSFIAAHRHLL